MQKKLTLLLLLNENVNWSGLIGQDDTFFNYNLFSIKTNCFKTLKNDYFTLYDFIPISFTKLVAEFQISQMIKKIHKNVINSRQMQKVAQTSPISEINQPMELKYRPVYQFYQCYQKLMKRLFLNKLSNLLKKN